MIPATSGRLYSTVTIYWPRIAAGLVAVLGVVELLLGGLTSDSGVEAYLTAWAAMTGGVWFLFEKAEKATAAPTRESLARWLQDRDDEAGIRSVPAQFAGLFDKVFGEDVGPETQEDGQVVLRGFGRSAVASIAASVIVGAVIISTTEALRRAGAFWVLIAVAILFSGIVAAWPLVRTIGASVQRRLNVFPPRIATPVGLLLLLVVMVGIGVGFGAVLDLFELGDLQTENLASAAAASLLIVGFGNLIFDYQSLIVTRRLIDYAIKTGRLGSALVMDFVATFAIWLFPLAIILGVPWAFEVVSLAVSDLAGAGEMFMTGVITFVSLPIVVLGMDPWGMDLGTPEVWILRVSLLTTFFTSMWLWVYLVSVPVSRVLLRMNSGVGFLLRVTDVENQPFRSMGFVSVLIVSGLFALGLPLVLL